MSIKPLLLSLAITSYPVPIHTNFHNDTISPDNRLCISQNTQEIVEGNKIIVSGIMSCRGLEPIADFSPEVCNIGLLQPSEFMLEEVYTSCKFEDALLDHS